jgi:uncharacterized membrane protein HdeD (DUF308 family)
MEAKMLDWMFMLFIVIGIIFIIMSLATDEEEAFWKILFIVLAASIFFILALTNLNIETAYPAYNATTGATTMEYSPYIDESSTYLTYFFGLMGCLCMIYMIILMFGEYYRYIDDKEVVP